MNFKVGQRVKRARENRFPIPIGSTATVLAVNVGSSGQSLGLRWDDASLDATWVGSYFDPAAFDPITDPGVDAFLARIKNLKPYEEPRRPVRQFEALK